MRGYKKTTRQEPEEKEKERGASVKIGKLLYRYPVTQRKSRVGDRFV
jgi:hypothetical protein